MLVSVNLLCAFGRVNLGKRLRSTYVCKLRAGPSDERTAAWGAWRNGSALTPDQKVGSSNLSALMLFVSHGCVLSSARIRVRLSAPEFSPLQNSHESLKALV